MKEGQRIAVWTLIAVGVLLVLDRMFKGVTDLFTDEAAANANRKGEFPELWDRNAPLFNDATPADLAAVRKPERLAAIGTAAAMIKNAPGLVNDNEAAVLGAFRMLHSRYEILFMNIGLGGLLPGGTRYSQSLGAYLDGFLDDATWSAIVDYLSTLPKYQQ